MSALRRETHLLDVTGVKRDITRPDVSIVTASAEWGDIAISVALSTPDAVRALESGLLLTIEVPP